VLELEDVLPSFSSFVASDAELFPSEADWVGTVVVVTELIAEMLIGSPP
jgi:hypothetical protein